MRGYHYSNPLDMLSLLVVLVSRVEHRSIAGIHVCGAQLRRDLEIGLLYAK
jgi:hypothetical protein